MKLISFDSYEQYVEVQRQTDIHKGIHGRRRRGSPRSCASQDELQKAADWMKARSKQINRGICHGARHGWEVAWLREMLPGADIVGTDLFVKEDAEVPCIQWDFHDRDPDWVSTMDFVYSNAIDHSFDPDKAMDVWTEQLKPGGNLILLWVPPCVRARGGDCFGAHLHEYGELIEARLVLAGVNYCGHGRYQLIGEKRDA